jgi:GT2 family glycosyltransferase
VSDASSTSPPDVSIVIVSWNVRDFLRDCVRSVIDETQAEHEIIVVDNASHDGSPQMIAEEFPDVRVITNDSNLGFAAANNQGIQIARGRNLLLLNPDTLVLDGAIDTMLEWLAGRADVGCVGCQVLETATEIQMTCFADPGPLSIFLTETGIHRLFPLSRFLGNPHYLGWDRTDERDVDVVSGMFLLLPRRVVEEVGLMDDSFFVYAEEADWCRRIRSAGHRCVFSPVARIIHREGGSKSTAQVAPQMYVQLQKSHLIYVNKHYGSVGRASAKLTFIGSMVTRGLLFGSLALISPSSDASARARLAWASVRFHLTSEEPEP